MIPRRNASIPAPIAASPLSYARTMASEREVQVAEILHHFDTCLGEEVYIFPMSDGSLLVQGIVEPASKRDGLHAALQRLPFPLDIHLYVPAELSQKPSLLDSPFGTQRGTATHGTAPLTLADFSNQRTVLYGQLSQHFVHLGMTAEETERKVAEASNEIVTLSRQTLLHAWALRRLNEEFDARRTAGLSDETLRQIERLRADHRKWISGLARQQSELMAGLGESGGNTATESKIRGDQELIELAEQLNSTVRSLFSVSEFAVSDGTPVVDSSLHQLVAVLRQLER